MRKRALFALLAFSAVSVFSVSAKEAKVQNDTYDYDNLVTQLQSVQAPVVADGYVVFTADSNARNVGIAFDFENYSKIHAFSLRKIYDYDGELTSSWYFYVLKIPAKISRVSYKLIVDGLWTTDPSNSNRFYDKENGLLLSYVDTPLSQEKRTEPAGNGFTKFVCTAEPGQKVRLAGSFTNWDSWIYEMVEVSPGRYELSLPLPAGTYYYAYFTGLKRFIDSTNPEKVYTADGKEASQIIIE